jgi:hypothetical protein
VYLHGAGNRSPTCFGGGAHTLGSRRVSWPTHQSEPEGGRARRRLVVRGGDLQGDPSYLELVGDAASWLETLHLASVGLDRVLSPHRLESWP